MEMGGRKEMKGEGTDCNTTVFLKNILQYKKLKFNSTG